MKRDGFDAFFQRLKAYTGIETQADLARELEVGRAAISLAKRKDQIPPRWILEISGRYGLNPVWLEKGLGEATFGAPPEAEEFERIPKVEARLSAGGGSFETAGQVEGYYSFRKEWINRKGSPKNMVLMQVVGNSMEPEIHEGDMVLIDQSKVDVYAGGIYAVGVEDTVMVKRIEKLPGQLVLISDNQDYSPIHLSGDELLNVRVIGKVLWTSREYN